MIYYVFPGEEKVGNKNPIFGFVSNEKTATTPAGHYAIYLQTIVDSNTPAEELKELEVKIREFFHKYLLPGKEPVEKIFASYLQVRRNF
mmetsp:Transcript_22672/g.19691  ORF Transcript_22672/g.19691 Transcript_22672/m.19691 type:complete len:89 (-) Transcript_22672:602-868(-)